GSLSRKDLVDSLQRYAKTSPVAANRCRANWSQILEYAVERGYCASNPLAGTTNTIAGGKRHVLVCQTLY
ncbi:MAG: phage integrase central domain-containing protein, partial [Fluviibacter sp.]